MGLNLAGWMQPQSLKLLEAYDLNGKGLFGHGHLCTCKDCSSGL
jgi:hypothetical protein